MRAAALLCLMVAVFACSRSDDRSSRDRVELFDARSILLEDSKPIYELDRAAPLRLRFSGAPAEVRLVFGGITRVLRPASTSSASVAEYGLADVPDGRAELQVAGEYFQVLIGDEEQLPDLLGFRSITFGDRGLERELDAGALPYFRVPSKELVELENVVLTTTAGMFLLPIVSAQPIDDRWSIVRTGAPAEPIVGRGELRFGARVWRVAWLEKKPLTNAKQLADAGDRRGLEKLILSLRGRARLEAMTVLSGVIRRQEDGVVFAETLLKVADAALDAALPSEATRMWRAAAYAFVYARKFSEVELLLARAEALDQRIGNVSGLVRADYYRVIFATELGRYRSARQAIARAEARAKRSALDADRALLASSAAMLFLHLGRHEEALAALTGVEAHFMSQRPVDRTMYLLDLGWTELKAIEAGVSLSPELPRKHLEDGLALARSEGLQSEEANAIANLFWLAELEDDRAGADRWMKELVEQPNLESSFSRPFFHFARASLALKDGRLDAARTELVELRRLAEAEAPDGSSEYLWRAAYGLGKVCRARNDRRCARERYTQAIEELERVSTGTDLGRSRALFLQDRRDLFDEAIELAIDSDRHLDALMLADRARTGVLRALEFSVRTDTLDPERVAEYLSLRDKYELRKKQAELEAPAARAKFDAETVRMRAQLQQLFEAAYEDRGSAAQGGLSGAQVQRALGDDEQLLVFARVFDRTDAFLVTSKTIGHHRNVSLSKIWPASVSHLYVVPGGQIGVSEVLAEASDRLERTTLSFLTHAGGLLAQPVAAEYTRAVVVADPDGTLPLARAEGSWVSEKLGVSSITGENATRRKVLEAIRGASLFHFAGHGILEPARPWDAQLSLAGGQTLSLEDLLIARPAIGVVVLSGCSTGASAPLASNERIGLAHAFLFAGARALMATTGDVEDKKAARFVREFYGAGGAKRPVQAWREAALAGHRAGDDTWKSFYVLGRRNDGVE